MSLFRWNRRGTVPNDDQWSQIRSAALRAVEGQPFCGPAGEATQPHIGRTRIEIRLPDEGTDTFRLHRYTVPEPPGEASCDTGMSTPDIAPERLQALDRAVDSILTAAATEAPGWLSIQADIRPKGGGDE